MSRAHVGASSPANDHDESHDKDLYTPLLQEEIVDADRRIEKEGWQEDEDKDVGGTQPEPEGRGIADPAQVVEVGKGLVHSPGK